MAKNITIIVLALLLGGLLVFTLTRGDSEAQTALNEISAERDKLNITIDNLRDELSISLSRVGELEELVTVTNKKIKDILDDLAEGNAKTGKHLSEYGNINSDFADLLDEYGAQK